jgi:hypothetical protein
LCDPIIQFLLTKQNKMLLNTRHMHINIHLWYNRKCHTSWTLFQCINAFIHLHDFKIYINYSLKLIVLAYLCPPIVRYSVFIIPGHIHIWYTDIPTTDICTVYFFYFIFSWQSDKTYHSFAKYFQMMVTIGGHKYASTINFKL